MASTKIQNQTETPTTDQTTIVEQPTVDLDYLVSEQKRINEAVKAVRAAMPKQTALDKEIARQQANATNFIHVALARRIATRIKLGQPSELAYSEVRAQYVPLIEAEVARLLVAPASDEQPTE
jgi:hypothetical protein